MVEGLSAAMLLSMGRNKVLPFNSSCLISSALSCYIFVMCHSSKYVERAPPLLNIPKRLLALVDIAYLAHADTDDIQSRDHIQASSLKRHACCEQTTTSLHLCPPALPKPPNASQMNPPGPVQIHNAFLLLFEMAQVVRIILSLDIVYLQ